MMEVKKKYIYDAEKLNSFYGMIPLDMYVSMVYFNCQQDQFENTLLSINDLVDFITECLLEMLVSELKFNSDLGVLDIYISSIPSINSDSTRKVALFFCKEKKVIVSEQRLENNDGIKMKNVSKEYMMTSMLSCHKLALKFVQFIIDKCNTCKKVSVIGLNETDEEVKEKVEAETGQEVEVTEEQKRNKFDLRDYQRI